MPMSFQQVIAGKVKLNGLGGIRRHLQERQRVKTNPNIDLSRSHLNHCIEELPPDRLNSRVNSRIKQLRLKKKPRSDAVGLEDIIISASAEFMLTLDAATREKYFTDALHFFQDRYGKENVLYCQCHMDESNPHIHIGIVPITPDGRLSAKSLFNPKSLEQLQTDFHDNVSKFYGLKRGQSHAKKYLPIQQFKAKQAKTSAQLFTDSINSAILSQQNISEIRDSAHFATSGLFFSSEDRDHIQLPTPKFRELVQLAEEGTKANTLILTLRDDLQKLQVENARLNSDFQFLLHKFYQLEESTSAYSEIPQEWRKIANSNIADLQQTFTQYCHEVNRLTVKVFISNNGNFDETEKLMHSAIKNIGVKDTKKYVSGVIRAAKIQLKRNESPVISKPSWHHPKPSQTDYKATSSQYAFPMVLPNSPDLGLDFSKINWDWLSEFDKDEIMIKKMIREL